MPKKKWEKNMVNCVRVAIFYATGDYKFVSSL